MTQPIWNDEQAKEALDRFVALVPKIEADVRFAIGVFLHPSGVYVPYVCLRALSGEENTLPASFIYIVKQGDRFRVALRGMIILVGIGIPANCWPELVEAIELDTTILKVWERYFGLFPHPEAI